MNQIDPKKYDASQMLCYLMLGHTGRAADNTFELLKAHIFAMRPQSCRIDQVDHGTGSARQSTHELQRGLECKRPSRSECEYFKFKVGIGADPVYVWRVWLMEKFYPHKRESMHNHWEQSIKLDCGVAATEEEARKLAKKAALKHARRRKRTNEEPKFF